jgi:hypothetical protein
MQGGRRNVGRVSVNLSGAQATRLAAGGQPQPRVVRPQAATPDVPRAGSREITRVDSAGLVEAGKVTGTPPQPVQTPKPAGSGSTGGAYTRGED